MSFILTFLGKGGVGRTTVAIAAAKKFASAGERVLLFSSDTSPALGLLLGESVGVEPSQIAPNLDVVQLSSTRLLEQNWEQVKKLEAKYLRSPTLKNVYGQELCVFPGMDDALALNAIREYNESGKYDVIVFDGAGGLDTIRMLGIPETVSWYMRRFRQVLSDSEIYRSISPFIQPISAAVLNVTWTPNNFASQPTNEATHMIDEGKAAVTDPRRMAAYLVTNGDEVATATAKYLWGASQQIGLTVGGLLVNQREAEHLTEKFAPLNVTSLPSRDDDWQNLMEALPNFRSEAMAAPKSILVDAAARQVKIFLPGFTKQQVKLTQSGPEITIEAGDQRHNIELQPPLRGQSVKGAKFQNGYLILSL